MLELILGKKTEIRRPRPRIGHLRNAADAGLNPAAGFVQKVGQGRIIGRLGNGSPGRADLAKVMQINFQGMKDHGGKAFLTSQPNNRLRTRLFTYSQYIGNGPEVN